MAPGESPVLIGMPGSGKSTVGRCLAQRTGRAFVDTDTLVEARFGCSLQALKDRAGAAGVRAAEAAEARALRCRDTVIATGGSMVYTPEAMEALRGLGRIVWLEVPLEQLEARVGTGETRGLARHPGQTLADLVAERTPLYQRYADIQVACGTLDAESVARLVEQRLGKR